MILRNTPPLLIVGSTLHTTIVVAATVAAVLKWFHATRCHCFCCQPCYTLMLLLLLLLLLLPRNGSAHRIDALVVVAAVKAMVPPTVLMLLSLLLCTVWGKGLPIDKGNKSNGAVILVVRRCTGWKKRRQWYISGESLGGCMYFT